MANFFANFFNRNADDLSQNRPDQSVFAQYDEEYIRYCIELEQTISALENALHTSDDPQEIAMETLKTACAFYGGDWAGILEVDLDLDIWTPVWWHNTNPRDRTTQLMHEFEAAEHMPSWLKSMKTNTPVIVPDAAAIRMDCPNEYAVYQRLRVRSVIATPFAPNPTGFLAIRNPTRYVDRPSMSVILAYVLHRAMAQQKTIDSAKLALTSERIQSERDIIINFFGDMEIITSKGVLKEPDFKSPKTSRVITYLMLNPKTAHPALEIYNALWPNDASDPDVISNSIRGCIFRFRRAFGMICDHPLIDATNNGYRLTQDLNIITDTNQFEELIQAAYKTISISQRVDLLKKAVALYRGPLYRSAQDEHWVFSYVNHYRLLYIGAINELLSAMAGAKDYAGVQQYATESLRIHSGNVKAHFWLIVALYKTGAADLARDALNRAKTDLTKDEYNTLLGYIRHGTEIPPNAMIP